jgi:hypothetical protein
MQVIGPDLHNLSKTIVWNIKHVPFKSHDYFDDAQMHESLANAMGECPFNSINDFFPMEIPYKSLVICSSLYKEVDVHDGATQQKHLPGSKQSELEWILIQYPKLFSRKLGCYLHCKVHLELKQDVTHKQVFKEELERLCEIGVLSRCGASTWLSPSFIMLKRMAEFAGSLISVSLMSKLHKKVYHLPKIQDILN